MKYLVVATQEELNLPAAQDEERVPIVTGVGGANVIKALQGLHLAADILNVGYCGSRAFPVGHVCEIGECRTYHPNCDFEERTFKINGGDVLCLTSGDFVVGGELPHNSVVDMELAYIAAMGFKNLKSVKYVSDSLDYEQYTKEING